MSIQEMINDPLAVTGELRLLALAVDHYQTFPNLSRKTELRHTAQLFADHELISLEDYRVIVRYICDSRKLNYSPGVKP